MVREAAIRLATHDDLATVLAVGSAALGWQSDAADEAVFRWKHLDNPFGRSWIWVAEVEGRIAGYRAFMRWELVDDAGRTWRCVRAVDTATHPDFRRMGIFRQLTTHAVDAVRDQGIDIVFNTPNGQSRPGYLKMGWVDLGRLDAHARVRGPVGLARLARARTSADKWPEPSTCGEPVVGCLDENLVAQLMAAQPERSGLHTAWNAERLLWRYGLAALGYRWWSPADESGLVFFRIRRRGPAREAMVGHVLAAKGTRAAENRSLRRFAREVDADYLMTLGPRRLSAGFIPVIGSGPRLTARRVNTEPPPTTAGWCFDLGDIELF